MNLRSLFLLCALCLSLPGAAMQNEEPAVEEKKNPLFLRLAFQPGWVATTSDFLAGDNQAGEPIEHIQAFKVELGWQTDGAKDWEQRYRLPALGLGVYKASFENGKELGAPVALYGWFTWPIFNVTRKLDVTTDLSFGAAFNWKPFDPEVNPANDAVSTRVTFFTEWGLLARYALTPRLDLMAGGMFTHFSNGGAGFPNLGVNALTPIVRVGYHFQNDRPRYVPRDLPPFEPFWEMTLAGGAGWKNVALEEEREYFGVFAATFELGRHVSSMGKLVGGADWTYDDAANAGLDEVSSSDKLAVGLFGGYEHLIGRFSIPFSVGYYIARGREDDRLPALYQKIGLKYHVTDRLFVGLKMRFYNFTKADFVEWTLGYDFP